MSPNIGAFQTILIHFATLKAADPQSAISDSLNLYVLCKGYVIDVIISLTVTFNCRGAIETVIACEDHINESRFCMF